MNARHAVVAYPALLRGRRRHRLPSLLYLSRNKRWRATPVLIAKKNGGHMAAILFICQ